MGDFEGIDRYKLEDMAHELAAQCRCHNYSGPCRFCSKLEKVHRQLDRIDIEEQVIKEITEWLTHKRLKVISSKEFVDAVSYGLATREWKKKDTPL